MKRQPIRTIRAAWMEIPSPLADMGTAGFTRNCHDGALTVFVGDEPGIGWHLSISHRGHNDKGTRYPSWDEIADARDVFLPADRGFVMHLPPASEYVALHATTFHLHEDRTEATFRDGYQAGYVDADNGLDDDPDSAWRSRD